MIVYGKLDNDCETPGQLQGSKTPNPETPRKKLKNYRPGPDPEFPLKELKILKIPEKYHFSGILGMFEFFLRNLGSGPGGNLLVFSFSRNFGARGFQSL